MSEWLTDVDGPTLPLWAAFDSVRKARYGVAVMGLFRSSDAAVFLITLEFIDESVGDSSKLCRISGGGGR